MDRGDIGQGLVPSLKLEQEISKAAARERGAGAGAGAPPTFNMLVFIITIQKVFH